MPDKCRFLYSNILADGVTTITGNSVKTGTILDALKDGSGSAVLTTAGTYTADQDLEYTVEIDSVAGGAEVGQSTFRWRTSVSVGWEASGVTTATTAIALNNGVTVQWASGTGDDFVLGDLWYFKAINRFATSNLHDTDRDTVYRSEDVTGTKTFVFDFGSDTQFNSVILLDHNFTNSATINIEANATDSWGAPTFSESITYNANKILHYTTTTPNLRYARLTIADASNPDGYIEMSEVFIGSYLELSRTFKPAHSRNIQFNITSERTRYNKVQKRLHSIQNTFNGSIEYLTASDRTNLETMISIIADTDTETLLPVYFNVDSNTPNDFYLMEMENLIDGIPLNASGNVYHSVSLNLTELAKSE